MRRVIVTLLICVFALGMNAQDMTSVFTAMPDQYIPQLEHAWRKDLVDLYTSGKESRLKNTMNGFSTLQKLTNDYLLLQTTERSTVEMKLLPLVNNTYVVCMISTVNGPVPDSRIEFFTTNWEPWQHPIYSRSQLPIGISSREWIRKTKPIKRPPHIWIWI